MPDKTILPAAYLDAKGKHCGEKAVKQGDHRFCRVCLRAFRIPSGEQIANEHYSYGEDGRFRPTKPDDEPFASLLAAERKGARK